MGCAKNRLRVGRVRAGALALMDKGLRALGCCGGRVGGGLRVSISFVLITDLIDRTSLAHCRHTVFGDSAGEVLQVMYKLIKMYVWK